jgi:hypothetical protein
MLVGEDGVGVTMRRARKSGEKNGRSAGQAIGSRGAVSWELRAGSCELSWELRAGNYKRFVFSKTHFFKRFI